MNRRVILFAALLAVTASALAADPPKPPPPAKEADDVQTLVYLGEVGPLPVRLRVLIDGKPYNAAWDVWTKKLFEYLDVNGDGTLSKEEAGRVPTLSLLRNHFQGAIGIFQGGGNVAPFAELDADKDGKVTPDELRAYYRKTGFAPFQMRAGPQQGQSGAMTEALFKQLDRNGDGKLSREELAAADEVLHRLDLDEDEMISQEELVPNLNPYGQFFFGRMDTGGPMSPSFQLLLPGEPASKLTKAILDHYDKDRNGKLSRAESRLDEATFARIDANKDGQLDAAELGKWLTGPAELEMTVRLGQLPAKKQPGGLLKAVVDAGRGPTSDTAVELTAGKDRPLAQSRRDGVVLTHGVAQIDVRGDNSRFFGDGARGFYVQQFQQMLKDKKDYVEKAEFEKADFLRGLGNFVDRDGDGKITLKELNAFFDAISGGATSFVTLLVTDHGTGLFELIDANRDGRLSIRELRTAWERVAPWDKTKAGAITREQVPRQYELKVKMGPPDDGRFRGVVTRQGGPTMVGSGRGPLWFRKMDRNGDGDVSRREWLGSMEDFKKIDTDGDGLISAEEAEKADAWLRERLKEKK